jgi:hypothetical protein
LDQIFSKIGNPEFKDSLHFNYGINRDIIKTINSNFNKSVKETKQIAPYLKGSTPEETCNNIWNFLKKQIKYVKDPDGYQYIKTPKRFLKEKTGDCKSYSLFSAGILKNIYPKSEVFLRYSGYSDNKIPSHVYTILKLNNKSYICDGVYNKPLKEKQYKHKEDYKMKIYTLSGIDEENQNVEGWFKDLVKGAKKVVQNVGKGIEKTAKSVAKGVTNVVQKVTKGAKNIGLAPFRASFLGLVAINVKNLARKLKEANERDPAKLKSFWENWGGDYNQLTKTINSGSTKKMIGYISQDDYFNSPTHEIGEPVTATALVASAGPILIAVIKLLKQTLGEKREAELGDSTDLTTDASKTTTTTDPDVLTTQVNPTLVTNTTATATGSKIDTKTMLLIGGGAVALYLLTKKKK